MRYQQSPYCTTPSREKSLWRYFSIDKFMAMLNCNALYFPKITLFEDQHEGTLSIPSLEEVNKTNLLDENTPVIKDDRFCKLKDKMKRDLQCSCNKM